MLINQQRMRYFHISFCNESLHLICLSIILCIFGYHHPSLEFECGKAVPIIRHVFVCVPVYMCIVHCAWAHVSSLPISTMARRVGGQRRNIAIKSMIHGSLDVTNKLSCHLVLKQKRWRWGESWEHHFTEATKITSQMYRVACQCRSQWGQQANTTYSYTHAHCTTLYYAPVPHPPPILPFLPSL